MNYKLIGPFKELLPMKGLPLKGPFATNDMPILKDVGILTLNGQVAEVAPFNKLYAKCKKENWAIDHLNEVYVGLPGFIDAHTHICFAGTRSHDYERRNAGMSYLDISKAGGGIWDTVQQTRASNTKQLTSLMLERIDTLIKGGITTIEVKSGYGLTVGEELKMLAAINEASSLTPIDLISTCLAAHINPKDFNGNTSAYLELMAEELFPVLSSFYKCNRIDAFVEVEAFGIVEARKYLSQAQSMGYDITIHADQFTPIASSLAVELGAVSADHLEASTEQEIEMLAKSQTVATVLPGASLGLGIEFAPARRLLDAGACLAIASDWNPGSAPMGNLLTQASILGSYENLSSSEVFAGITYRAAHALRMEDRGTLAKGQIADVVAFKCSDYREILYHQGQLKAFRVWKRGDSILNK